MDDCVGQLGDYGVVQTGGLSSPEPYCQDIDYWLAAVATWTIPDVASLAIPLGCTLQASSCRDDKNKKFHLRNDLDRRTLVSFFSNSFYLDYSSHPLHDPAAWVGTEIGTAVDQLPHNCGDQLAAAVLVGRSTWLS